MLFSTAIFLYSFAAIVNGYAGGSLYARLGGKTEAGRMSRLHRGRSFREIMDQTIADRSISRACDDLRCRFSREFHFDLLRFIAFDSIHCDVECHSDLFVYHSSVDGRGNIARKKHQWNSELPVSNQCRAKTHSRKEMVHGTECDHSCQWHPSVRIDLHRNVNEHLSDLDDRQPLFFFVRYFIFTSFWAYKVNLSSTVQRRSTRFSLDLLCLRFYVARLSHSRRGHCLCDDRRHVFLTQCRRLSMVNFSTRDQLMHGENIRFNPKQME